MRARCSSSDGATRALRGRVRPWRLPVPHMGRRPVVHGMRAIARHHHGRRHFRVSRVGCIVAGSVCEHAAGTRTEQRWRVRPWCLSVSHGTPSCGAWHARQCMPPFRRAFVSLAWAASSRVASANTLRALERYNEGVCDNHESCTVHHGLPVAVAWCARQHSGSAGCGRIARAGGGRHRRGQQS